MRKRCSFPAVVCLLNFRELFERATGERATETLERTRDCSLILIPCTHRLIGLRVCEVCGYEPNIGYDIQFSPPGLEYEGFKVRRKLLRDSLVRHFLHGQILSQ